MSIILLHLFVLLPSLISPLYSRQKPWRVFIFQSPVLFCHEMIHFQFTASPQAIDFSIRKQTVLIDFHRKIPHKRERNSQDFSGFLFPVTSDTSSFPLDVTAQIHSDFRRASSRQDPGYVMMRRCVNSLLHRKYESGCFHLWTRLDLRLYLKHSSSFTPVSCAAPLRHQTVTGTLVIISFMGKGRQSPGEDLGRVCTFQQPNTSWDVQKTLDDKSKSWVLCPTHMFHDCYQTSRTSGFKKTQDRFHTVDLLKTWKTFLTKYIVGYRTHHFRPRVSEV